MSEQNKSIVRRGIEEVWNRGDYSVVDELIANDFVAHLSSAGDEIHGPEGVKQYFATLREGFPDIHFTIEDQFAEADRALTRWTARATHTCAFQGIPPTGKQVSVTGMTINRFTNGQAVEGWMNVDELGLLHQLGVPPTATTAG